MEEITVEPAPDEPTVAEPAPTEPEPEVDSPEPDKKEKSHKRLSKKARLVIIISSIVGGLAVVGVLLYFLVFRKVEPVVVLTERDILTSHAWEKKDAPTVIWTFHADGTGELTTNKSNYYDTIWQLSQENDTQTLSITTNWLYKLEDSFTFILDRDTDTFTVKNLADETESVFVPLGTAEQQSREPTEELEKTEE